MRLRHIEVEAINGYSKSVLANDALRHAQTEQEKTTRQRNLTAQVDSKVSRFDLRETFQVTLWMLLLGFPSLAVTRFLTAITSGMTMPFPVGSGTVAGAVSFLVMALCVTVFGIGVGLRANRRTMVASIVVSKIVALLWTFLTIAYIYTIVVPEVWSVTHFSLLGMLLKALTIASTEITVALYVERRFPRLRKTVSDMLTSDEPVSSVWKRK